MGAQLHNVIMISALGSRNESVVDYSAPGVLHVNRPRKTGVETDLRDQCISFGLVKEKTRHEIQRRIYYPSKEMPRIVVVVDDNRSNSTSRIG